jgi:rhodanese-related sulfurtransferase
MILQDIPSMLLDHSFEDVYPLENGFYAWCEAGYSVEPKLQ